MAANRPRARFLACVLALMWGGCASFPLTHMAMLESEGRPYLTFTAHPHTCVKACSVTLTAEIHGAIQWCPTLIRWSYGDGTHDEPVTDCTRRIFSALRQYGPGQWAPNVAIYSDEKLVADPLVTHVDVGVQ